jgi:hypothetical protein
MSDLREVILLLTGLDQLGGETLIGLAAGIEQTRYQDLANPIAGLDNSRERLGKLDRKTW